MHHYHAPEPTGHYKMEPASSESSDESLSDDEERSSASDTLGDEQQQPYWTREAPIIKAAYTGDVETMRQELSEVDRTTGTHARHWRSPLLSGKQIPIPATDDSGLFSWTPAPHCLLNS